MKNLYNKFLSGFQKDVRCSGLWQHLTPVLKSLELIMSYATPFWTQKCLFVGKIMGQSCIFWCSWKNDKKEIRVLKSQNHCISTIDLDFCYNFMGFKFLEFFSGFHVGFLVFRAYKWNKTGHKIKNAILLHNFDQLYEINKKCCFWFKNRCQGCHISKTAPGNFTKNM